MADIFDKVSTDVFDEVGLEKPQNPLSQTKDILLSAAQKTLMSPLSFNSLTGGIGTQFGHDVKTSILDKLGVDRMLGEAISTGTDPQSILGAVMGSRTLSAEMRNPGVLDRLKSMQSGVKARTSVSKLLPSASISSDIEQGKPVAVQVEGQNLIKKTSNPMDIVNKFRNERDSVISQVDDLVSQNNQPVDPKTLVPRLKLILQKTIDNSSPEEQVKLRKALKTESEWLLKQKDFDTVKANARKRYLYEETQGTQKKQAAGKTIVVQPEVQLAKDAVAQALKEAVEKVHPDISKLNSRFSGLDQGVKAASKLVEASMEQGSASERIATQIIGRPSPQSGVAAAVRELPFIRKSVSKLSGDVEKQANKSAEYLMRSREKQAPRLLDTFLKQKMSNREYFGKQLLSDDTLKSLDDLTNGRPLLPQPEGIRGSGFTMSESSAEAERLAKFRSNFKSPEFSGVRARFKRGK